SLLLVALTRRCFFLSSRRRHTSFSRDWSSDVCSSDLEPVSSIDLWGLQRWIVNGRERNNPMPKWRTNARTAGFAIRHPKAAYKIGTGGRGSTDITGVAGRYARHFAESTGTSKAIGSKSNALRHVIWSSAIRSEFDAGISKRATNAHEGVGIAENQSVDFSKTFNGKGDDGLNLADHI